MTEVRKLLVGSGLYSGGTSVIAAEHLAVNEKVGPAAPTGPKGSKRGPISDQPPRSPNNVGIRYFPNVAENEPTVVINPKNRNKVVAGTHFIGDTGNRCVAHHSDDGGKTWSPIPIFMPQLTHGTDCSDPVLAYAPDGTRVYYAYLDLSFPTTFTVLVSYSDDDGQTWTGPIVALSRPAADYDKPWIGTHVPLTGSQANANWVYVSATRFDFANSLADCHIDFTRSSDKGLTWSPAQTLDSGNCSGPGVVAVVQGSRPQGGLGSGVIAAWYHSDLDGFRIGRFQIRTRYSADNGATFAPIVTAATDQFELQLFLGPAFAYHRWWGGMFPDVEIAPDGSAHIAYTHDPQNGSTVEDGDIRYIGSAAPPYAAWTAPTTVNDDTSGKAQGYVALEAEFKGGDPILYAIWEDHRNSATDNMFYDEFWAKRVGPGTPGPWAPNQKLTDEQSTSDFLFIGDYVDISLAGTGNESSKDLYVYGVWTDRRDEPTDFDFDDDVWGAEVPD